MKLMMNDLAAGEVFKVVQGRCHDSFPRICSNPFERTNMTQMRAWLKRLRRRFSMQQMAQVAEESDQDGV